MKLQDKIAIVTGAASGMGRAIAERYAKEGARVCVADINVQGAQDVAGQIGNGAFAVEFDCTRQESIDNLVKTVVDTAGGIDILVNNAGIFALTPVLEVTRDQWARVMAVNTEGKLFTLQAVAQHMIKQGRGGRIINFASEAGRRGNGMIVAYCASKAAVISVTQSAAYALIKHRINVNAIAPGVVDTPFWDQVDREYAKRDGLPIGEMKRRVTAAIPYGRMGKPDDFGGIAVFLASEDSEYVVGQTYGVDGGTWMA